MSKVEDIARVGYVLDNYDTVDILRNSNGDILRSKEFLTANGEHAPMLLYKKQINGTYYTAQAAVDGRYKKNWVISAYFNNKEGITQKLDAVAPSSKSSETLSASLPSNNIVSNTSQNYNTNLENNIAVLPTATDNSIKQKVENNVLPRAVNTETTNDTRSVITKLKESVPELSEMKPVSIITGTEFQKGSKKITETVGEFFASLGNKVVRKGFGEVLLTKKGIKSSISHGVSGVKASAFKAVPDVIKNGKLIDYQEDWKNRGYDTYIFAAPVNINGNTAYLAAVVRHDNTSNRFYLHEIVDETGRLFNQTKENNGLNTFKTTSANNASSGVSSPSINIISDTDTNYNTDTEKNIATLPTATDTNSNNNLGIVNQDAQQLFEDLQNAKTSAKDKARKAYQSTISGWAPFERMTKADTRRGGRNITGLVNKLSQKNGVFDTIKKKALFDINANKVSDLSLDSVVKQVPTNQLNDFNVYWHELHNIDRLAQNKPVTEHTADESRQIVAQAMLID